jgi:hypothetical protein
MFTNAISDQLTESFQELMQEIRAMRRELEGIRAALEDHQRRHAASSPRTTRSPATVTRSRRKVA